MKKRVKSIEANDKKAIIRSKAMYDKLKFTYERQTKNVFE
jgi:hypothetical protein